MRQNMAAPFFQNRVFFQTSFCIPDSVSEEQLQSAVDEAVERRFHVFCALIDEEKGCAYCSEEKKRLLLEKMKGHSITDIHNAIIAHCAEDKRNAFRLFWGEDEEGAHYLIIHAHHGVADGFMITSFTREVFHITQGSSCPDQFVFKLLDPIRNEESLAFPASWMVDGKADVAEGKRICAKYIHKATVYPVCQNSEDGFVNAERVIDASVCKRAVSLAKSMGSHYACGGCIHGMLVYCFLRAMLHAEKLPHSGSMTMNTIVNMRRYWSSSEVSPNLFFSSFPTTVSVEDLLQHAENCATIQKSVTAALADGLPLALSFEDTRSYDEEEIAMEISNLGLHPKDCFTRRLITQKVYAEGGSKSVTLVVWMDLESRFHFCVSCVGSFMSEERVQRLLDSMEHEIFELGVV